MYACQLWSKCTQTSVKCLQVAYTNDNQIMHYIPRNVSVRPHQVNQYGRTFVACSETICLVFYKDVQLHMVILSDHFKCLMLFPNLHFSPLLNASGRWPTAVVVGALFLCMRLIDCLCVASNTSRVLRGGSWFPYFLVIPLSPPICRRCVQAKHVKSEYRLHN